MKGTPGAATQTILKNSICNTQVENECLVRSPGELFGVHLGWSIFWCAQSGCPGGTQKRFKNSLKQMVWAIFGDLLGGTQLDHKNTKSVPMQRGARSEFREMLPMQRGARFAVLSGSGRPHLVGLDWSVWTRCSGSTLSGRCRSVDPREQQQK